MNTTTIGLLSWIVSVILGLYIKGINEKILFVRSLLFALIFGPAYLLFCISDLDAVLWRSKDKR